MSSRRKAHLTSEDRELWDRVRRSVTPLRKESLEAWLDQDPPPARSAEQVGPAPEPPGRAPVKPFLPPYIPPMSGSDASRQASLDDHTLRRIRKGRVEIDARIDLHGMTQVEAHHALYRFLEQAQNQDQRIVLVITGKGRAGDGILRRSVPLWLEEAMFHRLVGGWRKAHLTHGGEGALYVRLRRHEAHRRSLPR